MSSISSRDRVDDASSKRTRKRCKVASAWLDRSINQPDDWPVCFWSFRYTAMVAIASETVMTGTSIDRATRSAVRCRVPVSEVGMVALGIRCTLARAMREASAARMMAPSILASSERRWGLNSASRRKPPVQTERTAGSSPTMISAPCLACRMRSIPSRKRRAWRDQRECVVQRLAANLDHVGIVPAVSSSQTSSRTTSSGSSTMSGDQDSARASTSVRTC